MVAGSDFEVHPSNPKFHSDIRSWNSLLCSCFSEILRKYIYLSDDPPELLQSDLSISADQKGIRQNIERVHGQIHLVQWIRIYRLQSHSLSL